MPAKLMRCVDRVKRKKDLAAAYGICISSTGQKPHKGKKK